MISFRIFGVKISVDFTFFAVFFIFMAFDTSGYGILGLYACLIHEVGHLLCMVIVGTKLSAILFYASGIKITASERYKLSHKSEFFVLIGGSAVNIILFFICYFCSDKLTLKMPVFAIINLLIGLFNLLPVNMFDGGKITELILSRFFQANTAFTLSKILSIIITASALLAAIILYYLKIVNFTVVATLLYAFAVSLVSK